MGLNFSCLSFNGAPTTNRMGEEVHRQASSTNLDASAQNTDSKTALQKLRTECAPESASAQRLLERISLAFNHPPLSLLNLDLTDLNLEQLPDALLDCLLCLPARLHSLNLSGNPLRHLPEWLFSLPPVQGKPIDILLAGVGLSAREIENVLARMRDPAYTGPRFLYVPEHGALTYESLREDLDVWVAGKVEESTRAARQSIANDMLGWYRHHQDQSRDSALWITWKPNLDELPIKIIETLSSSLTCCVIYKFDCSKNAQADALQTLLSKLRNFPKLKSLSIYRSALNEFSNQVCEFDKLRNY